MRAAVRKWGNSLAIRIPKAIATELRIEEKSFVEMRLEKGSVVVTPTLVQIRFSPANLDSM